jgi:hypothetical protein
MNQTLNLVVTEQKAAASGWSIGPSAGSEKHFSEEAQLGFYAPADDR